MKNKRGVASSIIIYLILIVGSIIMLYPFLFQVLASLGSNANYYATIILPIPTDFQLDRYWEVLSQPQVYKLYINTFIRCGWYIFINILMAMLGGYIFSKLKFKGKNTIFISFLATMMIPGQVTLTPYYLLLARWPGAGGNNWMGQGGYGLIDSWPALLIGGLVPVYSIFLMKQMMETLPYEYEEAAKIDGAGVLRIIFRIYMPMVKPMLSTIVILTFVGIWNDYLVPLVFISTPSKNVITTGIATLMSTFNMPGNPPKYPVVFTLATIAIIPPVIVYLLLQKHFIQGFAMSGVKG